MNQPNLNTMSPQEIDKLLMEHEMVNRPKPMRQFIDNAALPALMGVVGAGGAAVGALDNLKVNPRLRSLP